MQQLSSETFLRTHNPAILVQFTSLVKHFELVWHPFLVQNAVRVMLRQFIWKEAFGMHSGNWLGADGNGWRTCTPHEKERNGGAAWQGPPPHSSPFLPTRGASPVKLVASSVGACITPVSSCKPSISDHDSIISSTAYSTPTQMRARSSF